MFALAKINAIVVLSSRLTNVQRAAFIYKDNMNCFSL